MALAASLLGCQSATAPSIASSESPSADKVLLHAGQWIGAAGGFVRMGAYSLEIPANAVSQETFIEMEQVNAGDWPVELSPHGIQFNVPVTLRMHVQGALGAENLRMYWWNPDARHWEALQSSTEHRVVSAQLHHFSRYTIN